MPEHVITWSPGRAGKGWVFPDGAVHAWPVSDRFTPNHMDVPHPEGSIRVNLHPDGRVEVYGQKWHEQAVLEAIPGTRLG